MLKNDTDLAWERWGKRDPYFGVLADQKYRKINLEKNKKDFFESGARHILDVIEDLEKHFGPVSKASALDFGCGVGRLLVPLAKLFNRVTGLDVSKSMLQETSRNLAEQGIKNVELLESDDALSALGEQTFDFIHTVIVLQHIAPRRGYVIIQSLLRHLSSNGAFSIHVSIKHDASLVRKIVDFTKYKVPMAYVFFNVLKRRRIFEPVMEMHQYDVGTLLSIFDTAGFPAVIVKSKQQGRFLSASFYSKRSITSER
jgi:ubiquinone/menaquinone biosynthesis C-methylase UbiE